MKSINKLLDWANLLFPGEGNETQARIQAFASDIEHEITEKYVKLPVDADGKPIRVGDVMEFPYGDTFKVGGISDEFLFYFNDRGMTNWTDASRMRHHKHDVKDELREFAETVGCDIDGGDLEYVIAKFAERLQLKETGA